MHKCKQAYLHFTQMRNVLHFVQPRVKNRFLMTHIHKQKALFLKKSLPCRLSVVIIVRVWNTGFWSENLLKALTRDRTTDNGYSNCSLHEQTSFSSSSKCPFNLQHFTGGKTLRIISRKQKAFPIKNSAYLCVCARINVHYTHVIFCSQEAADENVFLMADSCHVSVFQTNEKFIEEKSPQMRLQFIKYCLVP